MEIWAPIQSPDISISHDRELRLPGAVLNNPQLNLSVSGGFSVISVSQRG